VDEKILLLCNGGIYWLYKNVYLFSDPKNKMNSILIFVLTIGVIGVGVGCLPLNPELRDGDAVDSGTHLEI
jgi:hypothetical protein